jgi:hypothetical protein
MAVTLPFVSLILDWHPLKRIQSIKTFCVALVEKEFHTPDLTGRQIWFWKDESPLKVSVPTSRTFLLASSTVPVIFALEGGYDFSSLSDSVRITIEEMRGARGRSWNA